jgi:hypothetical protein
MSKTAKMLNLYPEYTGAFDVVETLVDKGSDILKTIDDNKLLILGGASAAALIVGGYKAFERGGLVDNPNMYATINDPDAASTSEGRYDIIDAYSHVFLENEMVHPISNGMKTMVAKGLS